MMEALSYGIGTLIAFAIILAVAFVFVSDITQKKHGVLRNYPVVGHLRYFFEEMGEYFRQYFFSGDREEMPFNRATRAWVYRLAKNEGGTIGFGSTYDLHQPGALIFVNHPFPVLDEERLPTPALTLGEGYCKEPFVARSIVNVSGMSYGAISAPAVRSLSRGAAIAGCWMDTGEGGLTPYHLEGGVLPGKKVTEEIAQIRGIPEGRDSISPNRHRDISSMNELLERIAWIRDLTGRPVGVKTAIGGWRFMNELGEAVQRRGLEFAPDFLVIDGGEGGSGAAPQALADHMGLSIDEALPRVVDALIETGLRNRVRVIASGKIITSARAAWALCVGADFINTARGFMFSLGCIQALRCHQNTCPTGVTTHNKRLQRALVVEEKYQRVANYAINMNREIDMIAHSCGVRHARELKREHVRIVQANHQSIALSMLYPYPEPKARVRAA